MSKLLTRSAVCPNEAENLVRRFGLHPGSQLREGRRELWEWRGHREWTLHFSTVVGCELLCGVQGAREAQAVESLWHDFKTNKRLALPDINDWREAGLVLARMAAKHGYEAAGQAKLVHDTLIALSARRLGISVVTLNITDFRRIAEFRSFSMASLEDIVP